jgi:thioester reductase-like protein
VSKVICLSRAKSHVESLSRVQESLRLRRRTLSADEHAKIESLAANVNEDKLGLTEAEYERIRSAATAVIHVCVSFIWIQFRLSVSLHPIQNAWPVNFVLDIGSFDEHIGGAFNLINLCLRSAMSPQPTFFFSSSVGTCQRSSDLSCNEDFLSSPNTASQMGYARSKWVVEKVCQLAAERTPISVGVLRIGQIVGDTEK